MTERENERNSPRGEKMKTRMQGKGLTGAVRGMYISHENNGRGKSRLKNYNKL